MISEKDKKLVYGLDLNNEDDANRACFSIDMLKLYIKRRKEKFNESNDYLQKFYFHGKLFMTDECGNFFVRNKDDIFFESYEMTSIPVCDDSKCEWCHNNFSVKNIADKNIITINNNNILENYHARCYQYCLEELQRNRFLMIFDNVYRGKITKDDFKTVPNLYCECNLCAPWFEVTTPDGKIRIGDRKHVTEISWLEDYKPFTENFVNESVTKEFGAFYGDKRYIHTWDDEHILEYLLRAKHSIVNSWDEVSKARKSKK